MILAFIVIMTVVFCLFCLGAWWTERKKIDPITRYQSRWPKPNGFRGW